jgi:hypothetical protein
MDRVNEPEYAAIRRLRDVSMTFSSQIDEQRPIFNKKCSKWLNLTVFMTENLHMLENNNDISHSVVLMKGDTKWRFEWKAGEETVAVKAITDIAKSTENDFDWFDAAMVCHEMTKITAKAA